MPRIQIELPPSIYKQAREMAKRDDISIDQLIAIALAEKISALSTMEYLKSRAKRGSRSQLRRILAKVPDCPPVKGDELRVK